MSLTVLFDLDDTLLSNNIDVFLPAYLKALGKYLGSIYPADVLIKELLAATGEMVSNRDPRLTLEEAFDAAFYSALGTAKSEMEPVIGRVFGLGEIAGPGAKEGKARALSRHRQEKASGVYATVFQEGHQLVPGIVEAF